MNELMELFKEGLLTKEELAFAIKNLKEESDALNPEKEKTADERREELAAKNRERAQKMRADWNQKLIDEKAAREKKEAQEKLVKDQDNELAYARTFLSRFTNSHGDKVYSKDELANMEYYEVMSLYDNILDNLSEENKNKIVEETDKYIEDNGYISFEEPQEVVTPENDVESEHELPPTETPEEAAASATQKSNKKIDLKEEAKKFGKKITKAGKILIDKLNGKKGKALLTIAATAAVIATAVAGLAVVPGLAIGAAGAYGYKEIKKGMGK